jgi:RNA polymerase sigma factor (sigma-70 family)
MDTDADLVRRSLVDPEAFVGIFDRHHDRLCAFLRGRVDSHLADDLAAQAFMEAFDRRASYDLSFPDAGPWLFGFALNLLRRHHRAEARRWRAYARSAGAEPRGQSGEEETLDRLAAGEAGARAARALADLPPHERDALLLLAWAELSYEEISRALDVPIGTVRSRLSRARAHLRARLADDPEPEATRPWTTST